MLIMMASFFKDKNEKLKKDGMNTQTLLLMFLLH